MKVFSTHRTIQNKTNFCKIEIHLCFFCRYHLPVECVMVSGTRQQAPVSGQCVVNFRLLDLRMDKKVYNDDLKMRLLIGRSSMYNGGMTSLRVWVRCYGDGRTDTDDLWRRPVSNGSSSSNHSTWRRHWSCLT